MIINSLELDDWFVSIQFISVLHRTDKNNFEYAVSLA